MRIKLDARLKAIAALVPPGYPVADIGTDHGYLPIYLVQNRICPSAVASDKARAPYENVSQLVRNLNLEEAIEVRRGEGLEVLNPGETATIILAGIGGTLICQILTAAPDVLLKTKRLVLQPQKDADKLRRWLAEHDWRIIDEALAYVNGFYYPVIAAEHGRMTLSDEEAFFGPRLLNEQPSLFPGYLEFKLAQAEALIGLVTKYSRTGNETRLRDFQNESQMIRKIMQKTSGRQKARDEEEPC